MNYLTRYIFLKKESKVNLVPKHGGDLSKYVTLMARTRASLESPLLPLSAHTTQLLLLAMLGESNYPAMTKIKIISVLRYS